MLKTLGRETKGFRLVSILTPIFMICEVIMEMIIPKLMASIIDDGVTPGNMQVIYTVGAQMIVAALFGLLFGILGAVLGSHAATGFARNLRRGMFKNIQTFSFANIDKYSTAGLVTRMTTDVTNIQNAYQMILRMAIRAPSSMVIAMIMAFAVAAAIFHWDTILWILGRTGGIAVTALVIIFQPELRKALEQLGSKNVLTNLFTADDVKKNESFNEKTINELVRASFEMGKVKTGALMVIERSTPLGEIERTGIEVDGIVTSQLLINIFEHNTPLHDGAVIIRGNRITSATCYLPLSDNMTISKDLGTRHRAALGMSEVCDALVIVVSEETGLVSVASGGRLSRGINAEELRKELSQIQYRNSDPKKKKFTIRKGWHR